VQVLQVGATECNHSHTLPHSSTRILHSSWSSATALVLLQLLLLLLLLLLPDCCQLL
jgi:hypothetical protein